MPSKCQRLTEDAVGELNLAKVKRLENQAALRGLYREEVKQELERNKVFKTTSEYNSEQFPLFPPQASAMPTHWTRTSLFSNIKKEGRRLFVKEVLESRSDYKVSMTGEQLDMSDNDVFLEVVRRSQNLPAGEVIYFERADFLRAIGRNERCGESYEWLQRSLERIASVTLFIDSGASGRTLRLIDELMWSKCHGYWLTLHAEIIGVFSKEAIAYIDLAIRHRLKGPLAKYLQNYVSGHQAGRHAISCETLMHLSGSRGRLRDFVGRALPAALQELEEAGLIKDASVSSSQVVSWARLAHRKSRRF